MRLEAEDLSLGTSVSGLAREQDKRFFALQFGTAGVSVPSIPTRLREIYGYRSGPPRGAPIHDELAG